MKLDQQYIDYLFELFGEENVDVQSEFVLIYFKEILLTQNEEPHFSHTITDLYVKISSPLKGKIFFYFYRGSLNVAEYERGFIHPHVYGPTSHELCLGTYLQTAVNNFHHTENIDNFIILAELLNNAVRQQSLEGGPYKHIQDLYGHEDLENCGLTKQDIEADLINDRLMLNLNSDFDCYIPEQPIEKIIKIENAPSKFYYDKFSTEFNIPYDLTLINELPSKSLIEITSKLISHYTSNLTFKGVKIKFNIKNIPNFKPDNDLKSGLFRQRLCRRLVGSLNRLFEQDKNNYLKKLLQKI